MALDNGGPVPAPRTLLIWLLIMSLLGFGGGLAVSRMLPGALPPVYRSMERGRVMVTAGPGEMAEVVSVRVAQSPQELAAGFMDVPAGEIRQAAIFFMLPCDGSPIAFHMERVRAPLDIAFLDRNGQVLDTALMTTDEPGRLWDAPTGTCAALELAAGRLNELGVRPDGLARIVLTGRGVEE